MGRSGNRSQPLTGHHTEHGRSPVTKHSGSPPYLSILLALIAAVAVADHCGLSPVATGAGVLMASAVLAGRPFGAHHAPGSPNQGSAPGNPGVGTVPNSWEGQADSGAITEAPAGTFLRRRRRGRPMPFGRECLHPPGP